MARISTYFLATRPWSFTVSVIPPILGLLIALLEAPSLSVNWLHFALTLVGCVLAHSGANALSDYFDYKTRVDREGTFGSSGVLVSKQMTPAEILRWALILYVLAGLVALYLVVHALNPQLLIALVGAGFVLGFFYTLAPFNFKYHALGDIGVFLAFGPLMVLGAVAVQTGLFSWKAVLYALPLALLVDAVLHSNNLRDIASDSAVAIKTVPILIGEGAAKQVYYALLIGAYIGIVILIPAAGLTWVSLLTFLSLPLALRNIRIVRDKATFAAEQFAGIDGMTAQLHMVFGALMILALLLQRLFLA